MKRTLQICMLMGLTLLVGCFLDEPIKIVPGQPDLKIHTPEVAVTADGGHFEVEYTLLNPVQDAELSVRSECSWVKNIDLTKEGVVAFDVAASFEKEGRSATIELIYPELSYTPSIVVNQAVGKEHSISFELVSAAATTVMLNVTPQDDELSYILILGNGKYLSDNGLLGDDEALWASDMELFQGYADAFGGDIQGAAEAFMQQGELDLYQFSGVAPDATYVAYAYGFDLATMKPTTEVSYLEITTAAIADSVLGFEFDVVATGEGVTLKVLPEEYDGYYYYTIFSAEDVDGATSEQLRSYCEAEWEIAKAEYLYAAEGSETSLSSLFEELAHAGASEQTLHIADSSEYVLCAFGIDSQAMMNSSPVSCRFTAKGVVSGM